LVDSEIPAFPGRKRQKLCSVGVASPALRD
jgi:hypothetical protein